jgi:hypothetical protein
MAAADALQRWSRIGGLGQHVADHLRKLSNAERLSEKTIIWIIESGGHSSAHQHKGNIRHTRACFMEKGKAGSPGQVIFGHYRGEGMLADERLRLAEARDCGKVREMTGEGNAKKESEERIGLND